MKRPAIILAAVLAGGLFAAGTRPHDSAGRDAGRAVNLIRIPRDSASTVRTLARLQIDVRQELTTCLLALAGGADLEALRKHRVRFTVLDRGAAGREFLIVGTGSPGALASLRAAGHAVAVEPGMAVFWTEQGSLSGLVPDGLPRKALAPRSVLPYLAVRPVAVSPAAAASAQDPLIETIVSLVSSPGLAAHVQTLQDFQTRYASTTNCEAAGEALYSSFSALGLDEVRFEPFTFSGSYASRNIIAEKTGETYPDDIYIICSHYDSTSSSRLTLAPGADDNASGTAAVLEAARILAPHPLDFTVRFIVFSAEEWGLYGSRFHAAAARTAGDRILGVINLDMIGYADVPPEDLQIIVNPGSVWLGDLFLAAGAPYGGIGGTRTVDASMVYSDHSPFWDSGYPALLAIEDMPLTNPYYHRTTDTLATLDLDFLTRAARASVGLLAELAQPIKDGYPRTPVGLAGSTVVYSSLFNTLRAVRLAWTAQTDAEGYNIYRSASPHAGYVKINPAPVTGAAFTDQAIGTAVSYYYVVTAFGPTGLESNRSREAAVSFSSTWSTAAISSSPPFQNVLALIWRGLR